jgi:hypothetical protein
MNNTKEQTGQKKANKQYTITKSEFVIFIKLTIPEKEKYIYLTNNTNQHLDFVKEYTQIYNIIFTKFVSRICTNSSFLGKPSEHREILRTKKERNIYITSDKQVK